MFNVKSVDIFNSIKNAIKKHDIEVFVIFGQICNHSQRFLFTPLKMSYSYSWEISLQGVGRASAVLSSAHTFTCEKLKINHKNKCNLIFVIFCQIFIFNVKNKFCDIY